MTDAIADVPPKPADVPPKPPHVRRAGRWPRWAWPVLLVLSVAGLFWAGMALRWWHWEWAAPIHFRYDMDGALGFGRGSVRDGYVNEYDDVARHPAPDWTRRFRRPPKGMPDYGLDYSPLRLLVFHLWAKWLATAQPHLRAWSSAYAVNRPLLLFNAANEAVAAALAGWLVWRCRSRAGRPYAATLAVVAAALLWLNPQLLASSWGRPAWEVWVLPAYLGAVALGAENQWLAAGAVIGVGMMLKGQVGVVAPVFVLWPLLAGNWRGALAWVAGFLAAAAVVVAPWMLTRPSVPDAYPVLRVADPWAIAWAACGVAGVAGLLAARRWRSPQRAWLPDAVAGGAALAAVVVVIAAGHALGAKWVLEMSAASVALVAAARFAPWRDVPMAAAAVVAALLFACVPLFHGSMNWYHIGFEYGAAKFTGLDVGGSTSLAAILKEKYGLTEGDAAWTFASGRTITVSQALWATYATGLVVSSWGMARFHRARDVRWLAAVSAPWLIYFAVAPLMHERYLLWGAAVASVVVGTDLGLTLLGVGVISVVSWANTMKLLMEYGNPAAMKLPGFSNFGTGSVTAMDGSNPDLGWVVVLVAAVFLYQCLRPARGMAVVRVGGRRLLPLRTGASDEWPSSGPVLPLSASRTVDATPPTPAEETHPVREAASGTIGTEEAVVSDAAVITGEPSPPVA